MAEYRIVAKVDPQTGAGTQKVKQDLRGIQQEADATGKSIDSMGSAAARSIDNTTKTIDRMTAAEFRAAGGAEGLAKKFNDAGTSSSRLEAALRRVLAATDSEAAEQLRLNNLLKDAQALYAAGAIGAERLAQVQKMAAGQAKELTAVSGSQRIGMQQLGFQLGDIATMYSLGARPAQIFASQIGQVSQALMLMGGSEGGGLLGKVGRFMGGPWGLAVTLGVTLLAPFIGKLFESNDALGEQIEKMKKDAAESEVSRQAHERWSHTLDGLIERQWKFVDAMKERIKVQGLADASDLAQAQRDQSTLQGQLQQERDKLANLRKQLQAANAPVALTGGRGDEARLGEQARRVSELESQIKSAETEVGRLQGLYTKAQTAIAQGQVLVGEQAGKAMVDLNARGQQWADRYQDALRGILVNNDKLRAQTPTVSAGFEALRAAVDKAASAGVNFDSTLAKARQFGVALQEGRLPASGYRTEMEKLATSLTKAAEAAQKAKRQTSDGVATFVSARQAIGIAGKEFQQAGFRVGENSQFGGVTPGVHKGVGHSQDRAIDINFGSGVVEANVPEIRARLDAMAVRYAARGYIVLWNGKRYDPSGKVTAIPGGQDQHRDHMHLEAPVAIVGKPTQASYAEAQLREEQQAANTAREQADFITNIVDTQNQRGLANGPESLQARMDKIVGDYKRRFNVDTMSPEDQKRIRDALIGGDEREVQQAFYNAYVKPVERLKALQGTTGLDRTIKNAQLEESVRQFGPLTEGYNLLSDAQNKQIETSIRQQDAMQRESALLEQIRGPLDEYTKMVAALNGLLAKGEITQTAYNARLAELANQAVQTSFQGLQGVDPASGREYSDLSAMSDENARYAKQLADFETYRDQLLQMGVDYDALELAAHQQHVQNLNDIDQKRKDLQLASVEDMAQSLTGAMKAMFGEQSRIYKAAFAVEKAVAIARSIVAIQTGIAQASALPFPANLPAIASVVAATASIISNIQAVALNFKDGGMVHGPGGPRSDSIPANLSRGEFVVNARATAGNRALLEAINAGRDVRQLGNQRQVENTSRAMQQAAPPPVVVPPSEVQVVNVMDPRAALNALNTAEGKKVIMNMMESDPNTFRRLLGAS